MACRALYVLPFFLRSEIPVWRSTRRPGRDVRAGELREDVAQELWIWRPIIAGKVSLEEVKTGIATIEDLLTINGLLDMQSDIEAATFDNLKDKR